MSDNRKYYYLKLKENYFDDDSIVLLESMQDGVLYSNILLKLYLKSLKHGGRLQLDEDIPYTAQMIATITRQQIGTVERALQIFLKLGLVEVLDSGTFYMSNIELLIGQSSTEAERKRAARLQNKALSALRTSGGHLSDIRPPEIEIELEKEIEIKREIYQQYGFSSPEQLEAAVATAYQEMRQTSGELKALETKLQGKRELRQQVLAYAKTKPIREGLKAQKSEKARAAYRQANESDFIIAEAAARYFKAQGLTKLPGRKALQAEIEQLISEKDGLYNTYHEQKQRFRELQTVKRNIDQILRREEPHRRKEQSHER